VAAAVFSVLDWWVTAVVEFTGLLVHCSSPFFRRYSKLRRPVASQIVFTEILLTAAIPIIEHPKR